MKRILEKVKKIFSSDLIYFSPTYKQREDYIYLNSGLRRSIDTYFNTICTSTIEEIERSSIRHKYLELLFNKYHNSSIVLANRNSACFSIFSHAIVLFINFDKYRTSYFRNINLRVPEIGNKFYNYYEIGDDSLEKVVDRLDNMIYSYFENVVDYLERLDKK